MKRYYFQASMQVKELSEEQGYVVVEGYASTSDVDRYGDIVLPTAFQDSLDTYMKNPQVLLQHDMNKPIGLTETATIDSKGLFVRCKININTDGVIDKIKAGNYRTFSIGFYPLELAYEERDGQKVCIISKIDFVELSVVSVPANAGALFSLAKSIKSLVDDLGKDEGEKQGDNVPENEKPQEVDEPTKVGDGDNKEGETPAENDEIRTLKAQLEETQNEKTDLSTQLEALKKEKQEREKEKATLLEEVAKHKEEKEAILAKIDNTPTNKIKQNAKNETSKMLEDIATKLYFPTK